MIISPQDTVKKKSPVMVNERAGFDESEPAVKETTDTKKTDKRSPFGVANAEPNSKKEKKEKNKVEKQTTASSNKETTNKKTQAAEPRIIQAPKAIVAPFETTRVFTAPAIEPKKIISTVPKDTIATAEKRTINQHYLAPKYRKYINQDGLFILFLVIGGLFGWINMFHRKRFIQVLNAFFVTRIVNQLIREENTLLQRVFTMVSVIFILIFSIFIFQAAVHFNIPFAVNGHLLLFTFCALGVSIIYFSKFFILNFVGYLFDSEKITREYFYNIFLINNFVGLLFVPLVLLIAYVHSFSVGTLVNLGLALYLFSFAYRIGRGALISFKGSGYSVFHILLYLCTLEILPMLLLIKLAKQSLNF